MRTTALLLGFALVATGCTLRPAVRQADSATMVGAATTPTVIGAAPASLAGANTPGKTRLLALRSWAHELAVAHCGNCHIASRPSAKPAALAIYNLDAPDWSATLSPERLRAGFTRRLNGKLDEAGRLRLREFVEGEIASR